MVQHRVTVQHRAILTMEFGGIPDPGIPGAGIGIPNQVQLLSSSSAFNFQVQGQVTEL